MYLVKNSGPLIRTEILVPLGGDRVIRFQENFDPFSVCMERLDQVPEHTDYARLESVPFPPVKEPSWEGDDVVTQWRNWRRHEWTEKLLQAKTQEDRVQAMLVLKAFNPPGTVVAPL